MMSEKNGARKSRRSTGNPAVSITGSSQTMLIARMMKLVTNSGTTSLIHSVAATSRITSAT